MRNKSLLFLLAAGLVLSLTGCEKEPDSQKGDPQEVHFAITTANPETKTHYTGEGTGTAGNLTWERIGWDKGDPLLIWSDYAVDRVSGRTHAAHYVVGTPERKDFSGDYPNQSWSILNDNADLGLIYDDKHSGDSDTYSFWSIYPASAKTAYAEGGTESDNANYNKVSFVIPDEQEKNGDAVEATISRTVNNVSTTFKVDSLKPNMNQAVMLAAVEGAAYNSEVELKYYPAFTAFEFELLTDEDEITLSKVVLTSTSTLAGTVTATVKAGTTDETPSGNVIGASTYAVSDDAVKSLTFKFPDGTKLTPETTVDGTTTPAKGVIFTVFALPQDITGMTLEFFDANGNSFAKGTLKYNKNDITFAACKKHCIRGIKVKNTWDFKYLTLDISPLDWVPVESEISSGDGVQATQFNVIGASNLRDLKDAVVEASTTMTDDEKKAAKEANKAYRQYWVFPAGQEVTVTYKIMMPLVGTWAVELCGDDAASFTVGPTTSGNLAGANASATYITLKINSTASGEKTLYLKTTVTTEDGETFSLDSETQLYDMRGYHYFVVNGDVDTE